MSESISVLSSSTIDVIKTTREINQLKGKIAENLLLIGQKLNQVKQTLPHGEWASWLEDEVQFSQETARKMMRIAEEYSNESAEQIKKMGSEKLYLMLNIPADQRKNFEEKYVGVPIIKASCNTIKEAIKEFKEDIACDPQSQSLKPPMVRLINSAKSNSKKIETLLDELHRTVNSMIIIDKNFECGTKFFHGAHRSSLSDAAIKDTMQTLVGAFSELSNAFNNLEGRDQWTVEYTGDLNEISQATLEFEEYKKEWDELPIGNPTGGD